MTFPKKNYVFGWIESLIELRGGYLSINECVNTTTTLLLICGFIQRYKIKEHHEAIFMLPILSVPGTAILSPLLLPNFLNSFEMINEDLQSNTFQIQALTEYLEEIR
ncbi:hypothetical protein BD770DRAFT_412190 [Pilaira anomala]|nr:hypothetical protein BD770DRAFT_412190 [Pilaira anomala]